MARSDNDKAERLASFFSSIGASGLHDVWNLANKPGIKHELVINITEEEVLKKLQKLKISKSPGPDGMHPRVLKEIRDSLVTPLTILFQNSLKLGTLPKAWKEANITAIFKKGKKSRVSNYRPVSLTSVVCKLMESLVRDALVDYMKKILFLVTYNLGF